MGKSKPPAPPDPRETSAASTSTNVGTAIANAFLGNVNQVTPDGSLTYDQTGSHTWNDPYTGKSYDIPTFTATQTLSPEQQAIQDQSRGAEFNLASLANAQSGFLKDYMEKPVDLNNEATEARLMELTRTRLDPILEQRRESEATRLASQGIMLGSTAYDRAMANVNQGENDAYVQAMLQGRGQAVQEALTERNQPINEITALLSGSQVSQPNFVNANMPTIPTTDTAGIINNEYNQRLGIWQQQQAQSQGILGGLFGLGGRLLSLSDRRTKEDIEKVGKTSDGQNIYSYAYKADPSHQKHVGLLAQEVEKSKPEAVITGPGGLKFVDYARAVPAMGSLLRAA